MIKHILSKDGFYWLCYYFVLATRLHRLMTSKSFLRLQFRCATGKKLNIETPQTFNEKLQWLKLYDHNPLYPKLVDKYEVKNYVKDIVGEKYLIPTLGIWNRVEEIEWDLLPRQFVLKCTHDSGSIIVCRDKEIFDKNAAIKKLKTLLNRNFYWFTREWPYKYVKPRIIAEKYMEDGKGELPDIKFFCFDGEPKALFIASDRLDETIETKFDFFDMDFNHLPFRGGHPNATKPLKKPENFELMRDLASRLSQDFPHVRVDFYNIDGKIYFGEYTFYHWGGMAPFDPEEWDYEFGSWIKLPSKK